MEQPNMQCAAKSKQSGQQCRNLAVAGKRVCAIHGGKTPCGIASPHFKHGRYSKYLPTGLLPRYEEACNDRDSLMLREEIALVDARLADLLSRVERGESDALWRQLQAAHGELLHARDDVTKLTAALERISEIIERGATDEAIWREVTDQIEQRRRLVEAECRRLVELRQYITSEDALAMVQALLSAIRAHVTDRHTLNAVSVEFARLMDRTDLTESSAEAHDDSAPIVTMS